MSAPDLPRGSASYLRLPVPADRQEYRDRLERSRGLHDPWLEPAEPDAWFDRLLSRNEGSSDRSYFVARVQDEAIAGVFNLSQIRYGPLCSAYLGYYALTPFAGRGHMREGIELLLGHAFGSLALHRVEANIQPGNAASIALARGAGFRREGFSPRYLRIRGTWRDHERWAITVEDRAGIPAAASRSA